MNNLRTDPAPTPAEIQRGKPWRWYFNRNGGEEYLSVRFSSEQQRVVVCLNGRRWGYGAGGPCEHDLAVVAKAARFELYRPNAQGGSYCNPYLDTFNAISAIASS